jgi:hypothetical protein
MSSLFRPLSRRDLEGRSRISGEMNGAVLELVSASAFARIKVGQDMSELGKARLAEIDRQNFGTV